MKLYPASVPLTTLDQEMIWTYNASECTHVKVQNKELAVAQRNRALLWIV